MDNDANYNLWKFFKDEHELILTAGQLEDIIREVNKYNEEINK